MNYRSLLGIAYICAIQCIAMDSPNLQEEQNAFLFDLRFKSKTNWKRYRIIRDQLAKKAQQRKREENEHQKHLEEMRKKYADQQ